MTDDVNPKSPAAASEHALRPKKPRARKTATATQQIEAQREQPKEPSARRSGGTASAKSRKAAKSPKATPAPKQPLPKHAAPKKKSAAKRKSRSGEAVKVAPVPQITSSPIEDPIGDVSDGEAWIYTGELLDTDAQSEAEAFRADVNADAIDGILEAAGIEAESGGEAQTELAEPAEEHAKERERDNQAAARPPVKLERLQKILSQAGIASRRRAEEMIVAGRIEVNGQVVTALGSKADPEHDYIRVDGKLLHGAERHRYFVLNKPKAYVTTVSDPQGRPTVMEFVSKLGERVYPVGRLDFQSEGLLLMTNDGALANQLTRASSGVEKTYVVKISGQPDEEELERLRDGVMIERGGPSSPELYGAGGRVRTAPARIRQIRPGENPWYEVVLTEGRNREIRKMFSAVGHYVEKIRRVGYGPLVLDVEPGQLRELTLEEVDLLRQVAEGKLKPRRLKIDALLPKEAGRAADSRPVKRGSFRPSDTRPSKPQGKGRPERGRRDDFRRHAEPKRGGEKEFRPRKQEGFASRGGPQRNFGRASREWQPRPSTELPAREGFPASSRAGSNDDPRRTFARPREARTGKPAFGKPDFGRRNEAPAGKPDFRRRSEVQAGKPSFRSRSEARTGKPDFARRGESQFHKSEDPEFRSRPDRPGVRWQSGAPQRSFRLQGRAIPGSGGKSRPEAPAKFAQKGRFGNRYPQLGKPDLRRGKPEGSGREHFSGGRNRDRFSSNRKPDHSRTGPHTGGHRPGGKRRG